ncbi:MAG: ISL3 family transposase [Pseudomonadales bacterium]|nr:ISL3 family transposase [Pseudomonadales bacterium]|tara:strand:+ start:3000 stop:4331 length:1332 start_codon:yes stop_codon:yes gene_type:complete
MHQYDLLNLDTLHTSNLIDEGDHYIIEVDGQGIPGCCPHCQTEGPYRHGTQQQQYIDIPMHGKPVLLRVDRARFRCKGCGKTFFSHLPDIDPKRKASTRFVKYIEQESLKKTFALLSRETGIDEKTIKNIFNDYVDRLGTEIRFETPEFLGIDELKIIGEYRCMITNVNELSVFDLLPNRRKVDLMTYFKSMPDKHKVKVVTMDMWRTYKDVVNAQLPGRDIVVDRWHVVRMANDALEGVRKRIRKGLNSRQRIKLKDDRFILLEREHNLSPDQREKMQHWFELHPELELAYRAKESFHEIYTCGSKAEAQEFARAWVRSLPSDIEFAFDASRTALTNWWDEIFNFYDHRVTNAYTESTNRLAKDINRMGRGYSFEVMRARLIYEKQARKPTTKLRGHKSKKGVPDNDWSRFYSLELDEEVKTIEYGPHIPTLCDLLEKGYFS